MNRTYMTTVSNNLNRINHNKINASKQNSICMGTFLSYPPAPSSEPRNVTVVNVTSTNIHFSWQPPLSEDQNGVITLNVTSLETGETEEVLTESTAYMLASVNPHTLYAASVAAQTNAGRGPFSALISVQTLEDGMLFTDIIQATLLIQLMYHLSTHRTK